MYRPSTLRLVTIGAFFFLGGCASESWVDERLNDSLNNWRSEIVRGEIETRDKTSKASLENLRSETQQGLASTVRRITELEGSVEKKASVVVMLEKTSALEESMRILGSEQMPSVVKQVRDLENLMTSRQDLYAEMQDTVQKLLDASAKFNKHKAEVDTAVASVEAEVQSFDAELTALTERLQQLNHLQYTNLKAERETLLARLGLIDKVMNVLVGVDDGETEEDSVPKVTSDSSRDTREDNDSSGG